MVVHRSLTWRSFVYRGWSSNRFRSTSCCGVLNAPLVSLSLYTKNIQKRNGETPWNNPGQAHCVSPGRINSASSRSEFRMPIPRKQGLKKLGFMAGIVRQISMQHDTTIKCATGRSEGVFLSNIWSDHVLKRDVSILLLLQPYIRCSATEKHALNLLWIP